MRLFTRKPKTTKLSFCINNLDRFYNDDDLDALEEFFDAHNVKVKEMDCLSYCDECECSPYVLINNSFMDAKDPKDLLEKLKEMVQQ